MGLPHRGGKDVIPNDVLDECIKDVVTTGYRNRWQAGHRDVKVVKVYLHGLGSNTAPSGLQTY
jgi:hypothetical protein